MKAKVWVCGNKESHFSSKVHNKDYSTLNHMGPYVFVATEYKKLRIVEQNMISFCFVASLISYD